MEFDELDDELDPLCVGPDSHCPCYPGGSCCMCGSPAYDDEEEDQ